MADISGNPTPLNVPVAQALSGALTPLAVGLTNVATAPPPTAALALSGSGVNVPTPAAPAPPPLPAVPDMPYGVGIQLTKIVIAPANRTILIDTQQQYTATGFYSDSSSKDITSSVTWSSSNTNYASVAPGGLATATGNTGTTSITGQLGNISGSTNLTVANA